MKTRLVFQSHPTPEMLEDYSFNRLSGSPADVIEQHLLLCGPCQCALEETQEYIRLMKAAASQSTRQTLTPLPKRLARRGIAGAVAAGLAGMIAIGLRPPPPRALALELVSFRGGNGISHAPSRRALEISFKTPDLPTALEYRVEVVTAGGERAWGGSARPSGGRLLASLPATLRSGRYWIRLYGAGAEPLYEYGLQLE